MGYNKFIRSGTQLELYEYEKDLPIRRIKRTREILRRQSTGIRTLLGRSEEGRDTLREIFGGGRIETEGQTISSSEGSIDSENMESSGEDSLQQRKSERQKKRKDNAQRSGMAFRRIVNSNLESIENLIKVSRYRY